MSLVFGLKKFMSHIGEKKRQDDANLLSTGEEDTEVAKKEKTESFAFLDRR